jgi:hypothetical protein
MESLGDFYEDDRRRDSPELHFGTNWRSTEFPGYEFSVFWLADTHELCVLRSPIVDVKSDGIVSRFILGIPPHTNPTELRDDEVKVDVLVTLTERHLLERLAGWESRRSEPDGYDWLRRAARGSAK